MNDKEHIFRSIKVFVSVLNVIQQKEWHNPIIQLSDRKINFNINSFY